MNSEEIDRKVTIGLPHSEISGSKLACSLPELIAAYHVLLRLKAPNHPPMALSSLTNLEFREDFPKKVQL